MKRDLDIIRDLMLAIENRCHGDPLVVIYNRTPDEQRSLNVALFLGEPDEADLASANPGKYHQAQLLYEAGFIAEHAYYASRRGAFTDEFYIERMTNDGHDFLDSIRDDGIFAMVKDKARVVGGTASLAVIKALADNLVKMRLDDSLFHL